ncbi:MAG: sodium:proton antiporter [Steroidobacteraceae bacterium]
MLDLTATILVITALLAYLNQRLVRLPTTVGVMSIALGLSIVFVGLDKLGLPWFRAYERGLLGSIDFSRVLMQGMLSFLLFAGALHVDFAKLRSYRWQVGILAVFGTAVSAALIGIGSWYVLKGFSLDLPITYCLVFGALISPTDPIAVLGILKGVGAPPSIKIVIAGESLFNDGVGVVLFAVAVSTLGNPQLPTTAQIGLLLLQQAGGGIAFGLALGYVTYFLLRSIDSYQEEVLLTLAAVMGGYALADRLHLSGPLAMVAAGLVIGNQGRAHAMSDNTRERLDVFWELIDSILNSVLFVLMGFEVILLKFSSSLIIPAAAILALTLATRLITISIPIAAFRRFFALPTGAWKILTWGGLRGGISVALALSLSHGRERDVIVSLTYVIVVFSILVQGLSIGPLIKRVIPCEPVQP